MSGESENTENAHGWVTGSTELIRHSDTACIQEKWKFNRDKAIYKFKIHITFQKTLFTVWVDTYGSHQSLHLMVIICMFIFLQCCITYTHNVSVMEVIEWHSYNIRCNWHKSITATEVQRIVHKEQKWISIIKNIEISCHFDALIEMRVYLKMYNMWSSQEQCYTVFHNVHVGNKYTLWHAAAHLCGF